MAMQDLLDRLRVWLLVKIAANHAVAINLYINGHVCSDGRKIIMAGCYLEQYEPPVSEKGEG